MKIKSLGAVLMALLLVLGVSTGYASSVDTSIKGELTVWGDQTNRTFLETVFEEINNAFMEQYPNVKITYDFSETTVALQVAIQSDSLPDLFFTGGNKNPTLRQLAEAGSILPLDGHIDNMDMYNDPYIKKYVEVEGKTYAVPSAFMDSQLVYYNKDLFEQAGVSAPKTWDEFLAACDGLLAAGIQPIAMPGATMWENSWACFAIVADFATDAMNKIKEGTGTWLDPTIAKAFNNFRLLAERGYYGPEYKGINQQEAQLTFTTGKAAMYVDGTWAKSVYTDSGINLGFFYIPNDEGVRYAALSCSNWMTYSISAKTKYPDAAYAYANFLAQLPAQQMMENYTELPIMIKIVEPANDLVKAISDFDRLGVQMNSVATACASDKYNTSDLLMSTVVPRLLYMEITGEEACQMMHEAATYPTPNE